MPLMNSHRAKKPDRGEESDNQNQPQRQIDNHLSLPRCSLAESHARRQVEIVGHSASLTQRRENVQRGRSEKDSRPLFLLVAALRNLGHDVDSVNSLRLKGIDNGALYRLACQAYDLCFTRDAGFAYNVRQAAETVQVKVLRVVIPQQRGTPFTETFVKAFRFADWTQYGSGNDWP